MAAPNQMKENEHPKPPAALDPFAVDFFGGAPAGRDDRESLPESGLKIGAGVQKKSEWYKSLPRITNREAAFSNLLSNLPENITGSAARAIAGALARYTFQPPENIECELLSVTEVNLNQAIQAQSESLKIFLSIVCQTENSRAFAALNVDFAAALIDTMLDEQSAGKGNSRDLSPVETAIIEFLTAGVLGEINNFLGEKILLLESIKNSRAEYFEPFERGAQIVFEVRSGEMRGAVGVFAPQEFLRSLDKTQNPIFTKKAERKRLDDFERFARRADLRLQIGTTHLAADSLWFLEGDDVVLIEHPAIAFENGNFGGQLQVFVGRGKNFRLRGIAAGDELSGGLQFKVEEILSEEARRRFTPAKFKMDVNKNDLAGEEGFEEISPAAEKPEEDEMTAASLENLQVALRVEIARNQISLRELQNLRSGQIIALGCSPNDPVLLVTDRADEPVATGELVEIEGQLGVRLTKVFI